MKAAYLFFIAFLIYSCGVFAQTGNGGTIQGKIADGETGKALTLAGATIMADTGSKVRNVHSGSNGEFKFDNLPFGTYSLLLSHLGFDKALIEDIEISPDVPVFDLGTIKLRKKGKDLNEVVITEKQRVITFDGEQITYNVAKSLFAEGSTASDLLNNVPMVNIGPDGTPSIAGKRNTRIFIDGEPSDYMTANIADLLNVLPSDAIEKIEVMLNPPVKYSADGDGIINIILKKDYHIGLNGIVSYTLGALGNTNANTYVAYKQKKFSFTGSYGFISNPVVSINNNHQRFFSDTNFYRNLNGNSATQNFGHNLSQSINWAVDSTKTLRLSSNFNFNRAIGQSVNDFHYLSINEIQNAVNNSAYSNHSNSLNYVVNLNYIWRIKNRGGRLDGNLTYSGNTAANNRFLLVNYENALGLPIKNRLPFEQTYQTGLAYNGVQGRLDYEKPLGNTKNTAAFGLAVDIRTNNNNQDVENINVKTNAMVRYAPLSNNFVYHQGIYSGYGSTTIRTNKGWVFRAGGRAEVAAADYLLQITGQAPAKEQYVSPYLHIFPNASISKRVRQVTIGLSYSEHIARPTNTALNPAVSSPDSNNVSYRNPYIVPAYTQQVDLTLVVFNEKWSFYPRIGYSYTNNIIESIITSDRLGRALYRYDNLGPGTYSTLNLYGDYRPAHNLIINGGTTIGRVSYQMSAYLTNDRVAYSFYGKLGMSLLLPRNTAFEGNLNYYTNPFAQGNTTGPVTSSLALRKMFYNNKLRLRMVAANIFNQSQYNTVISGSNFNWQNATTINTRNISATVSYSFTKGNRNVSLPGIN